MNLGISNMKPKIHVVFLKSANDLKRSPKQEYPFVLKLVANHQNGRLMVLIRFYYSLRQSIQMRWQFYQ